MQIWVARHGEAVDPDQCATDFDRALTDRGRRQVGELARWLAMRTVLPELIWHSPLVRAGQTAQAFAAEWPAEIPVEQTSVMAPGMRCERLLEAVRSRAVERILCVGHQPDVGECVFQACGGRVAYSPGAVACLEFGELLLPRAGRLKWLTDPDWFG